MTNCLFLANIQFIRTPIFWRRLRMRLNWQWQWVTPADPGRVWGHPTQRRRPEKSLARMVFSRSSSWLFLATTTLKHILLKKYCELSVVAHACIYGICVVEAGQWGNQVKPGDIESSRSAWAIWDPETKSTKSKQQSVKNNCINRLCCIEEGVA